MVWIIAILCLGLVGATGYYQGPIRAGFSLFGLIFGALLAGPLSPLTRHLLPLVGLEHPIWQVFLPQAIAFIFVLIIFKIAGNVVHRKVSVHYKYKADERKLISWERLYSRLGFCVGLLNGSIYFFLLLIPIYVGGYFTAEAASTGDSSGAQFLTKTRHEMHSLNLDRVVAPYDPTPSQIYQASDIASMVLHNPLLESRLSHYPPFLTLAERPQFQDLANDVQLQEMIQTQAKVSNILKYPKVQAIVTNAAIAGDISAMIGNDLGDLQEYLLTGKSDKYDKQSILGIWTINPVATLGQERRKHPGLTPVQLGRMREDIFPVIQGLSLTATTANQMILKKQMSDSAVPTIVATGTWKKDGDDYEVTLPGSRPETTEIQITDDNQLLLPKDGYVFAFDKEM